MGYSQHKISLPITICDFNSIYYTCVKRAAYIPMLRFTTHVELVNLFCVDRVGEFYFKCRRHLNLMLEVEKRVFMY